MVRIRQQRRGKGTFVWRAKIHKAKGPIHYPYEDTGGQVTSLIRDPGHTAPIARVRLENGRIINMIAPETLAVGDEISINKSEIIKPGNVLELGKIPEGTPIYNIEILPGDGGKFTRSSGTFATVISHTKNRVRIRLPSKKFVDLSPKCRATVGKVGGSGRLEKPFVKAGRKHLILRARGKKHPKTSATAMNVVDHPFGGSAKPGRSKTSKRGAPPGQKIGNIAAKRSGKKKR